MGGLQELALQLEPHGQALRGAGWGSQQCQAALGLSAAPATSLCCAGAILSRPLFTHL